MITKSPGSIVYARFIALTFSLLLSVAGLLFGANASAAPAAVQSETSNGQTATYPTETEIHLTLEKYATTNADGSVYYDTRTAENDNVDRRIVEVAELVNQLEREASSEPGQIQPNDLNPTNYGRWCGKNNSGPGDPIDELDRACMGHDHCLNINRPTCDCDREFVNRLRQIRGQFSGWSRTYLEAAIIAVPRWHGCRV
ncbi:hypothetical protein ACFWGD_10155 [Corynebacterium sp. NPDC060344]|uniref:hypothetical protein n=1 Tax=Corynebacterium sp. NPDC060344 TaxID=3347101 RepID=UPI003669FB43